MLNKNIPDRDKTFKIRTPVISAVSMPLNMLIVNLLLTKKRPGRSIGIRPHSEERNHVETPRHRGFGSQGDRLSHPRRHVPPNTEKPCWCSKEALSPHAYTCSDSSKKECFPLEHQKRVRSVVPRRKNTPLQKQHLLSFLNFLSDQ